MQQQIITAIHPANPVKIYRRLETAALIGVSPETIRLWVKAGNFPKPVKVGARAVGWRETDLMDYLAKRQDVTVQATETPA